MFAYYYLCQKKILMVMENKALEMLMTRRSIRQYKKEQIKDEELKAVLDAGIYAPNGMGKQDSWIVAVQNKEIIDQLVRMNAEILGMNGNPYYNAPTIVLVFGSKPESWANTYYDGALVLGNMMNAAHALGLGSCWINREIQMFNTPEGKELMKKFGLPDNLMGIGAIALGYPAGKAPEPKPRKKEYYRIIK